MNVRDLKITTAVAAALLAGACNREPDDWTAQQDTAICTDKEGRRVSDQNCRQQAHYRGGHGASSAFLWYFLGRNSAIPYYGDRATGGSYTRAPGTSYFSAPPGSAMTRSAAIARGGFGSSARSFGGVHA